MTGDARFEDGREAPLHLGALDGDDLRVIAALCQDAVLPGSELSWRARERRFAMLINRFRWEDAGGATRPPERVQSVLSFANVTGVASQGLRPGAADAVLSVLSLDWAEDDAPAGTVTLHFAGDGAIRLRVEALEVTLRDVTRPYAAPSGRAPRHPE